MKAKEDGDFAPGELSRLLAEADAAIDRGEVFGGEEVFREIRKMSESYRRSHGRKSDTTEALDSESGN